MDLINSHANKKVIACLLKLSVDRKTAIHVNNTFNDKYDYQGEVK